MKFIAQVTGQGITMADGTAYKASGRLFDVADNHAEEVASMGFLKSDEPAKRPEPEAVVPDDQDQHEEQAPRAAKQKGRKGPNR